MDSQQFLTTVGFVDSLPTGLYPAGTQLVLDNFTGGAAVNPAAHTPDVGAAWAGPDSNNGVLKIAAVSNDMRLFSSVSSSLIYQPSDIVVSDYSVLFKSRGNGTGGTSYIRARYDTASSNYYYATVDNFGAWIYGYALAGVETPLGSGTKSPYLNGVEYNMELRCVGTTISLWFDLVQVGTTTDSHVTGAGKAGCGMGNTALRSTKFEVIAR